MTIAAAFMNLAWERSGLPSSCGGELAALTRQTRQRQAVA
jgi:hypothetical protein